MWRMRHPDGRQGHTVIATKGPEALVVVVVNGDLEGFHEFKTWDAAIRWTGRMCIHLAAMGWRFGQFKPARE
jgi:hypothetical protein